MKIIKGALFQLLSEGRKTIQIGNRAIGHVDFEDHPDGWFIAVDGSNILRPLVKAETGDCLLFLSRAGFLANEKQIRSVFEAGVVKHPRTNPPYTWADLVNHVSEWWAELETRTRRKIGRLQKQVAELERLSA